ncbi:MAG: hypothetical protein ACLPZM_01240 [Thermoplasmata archaeon]
MNDPRWVNLATIALVAVLVAGAVASMATIRYSAPASSSTTPAGGVGVTHLNLTISYNAGVKTYVYAKTDLSIAANTPVVVTITNYDPAANPLFVPWDNRVVGTVGGIEVVNRGDGPSIVTSLPSDGISHTFTVLDAYYNISVPIPPASSASVPSVVTFELVMNQTETTSWACVCQCMPGNMMMGMYGPLVITG